MHLHKKKGRSRFREANLFDEVREPFLGMLSPQVEEIKLGLERSGDQLVHGYVFPIELEAANSVSQIALPSHGHRLEIEHLDIAIVVACRHDSLLRVVGITERDRPTVPSALSLSGLDNSHRSTLLPGIPHLYATVSGSGRYLGRAASQTSTAYSVDGVYYLLVRVSRVNWYRGILQIVDVQFTL